MHEMLCSWQQAAVILEMGEISKEDYDKWRYHYDSTLRHTKILSQELERMLAEEFRGK